MKAVILAAGYGVRFLPVTKTIPKEMLPIINVPAIDFTIDELIDAGVSDILIISHRKKKTMEDYFDREPELEEFLKKEDKISLLDKIKKRNINISFVRQSHMSGSGDALLLAEPFLENSPFILAFPDDVVIAKPSLSSQLINIYNQYKISVLACENIQGDVSRFGVIKKGDTINNHLYYTQGIIEKPKAGTQPSQTISIGRYLLTPSIFSILKTLIKQHTEGEFFLTSALEVLAKNNELLSLVYDGKRLDIGTPDSYIRSLLYVLYHNPEYKPFIDEANNLYG